MKPVIEKFVQGKFDEDQFKDVFKAESKMSFTNMVMEKSDAKNAPEAFEVEKDVAPSGWLVKYQGAISAPKESYYRFVGRFDDILLIYVNDKLVLDGCVSDFTGVIKSPAAMEKHGHSEISELKVGGRPLYAGPWFKFRRGDDIKIIIGESPGGFVGGGIFIQEKGKEYKKTDAGVIKLPPFTTVPLSEADTKRLESFEMPVEVDDVPVFKAYNL